MERPPRRRYLSLSECQDLLSPLECLPLAVSDVLFKYIDVLTRIRLMCVSRAMRAIVDSSAEIEPPHLCNNTLSIKFINADISDASTEWDDFIRKFDEDVRLDLTVRATVTFAGQTASETIHVPLKNYYGDIPAQETPFLDRCIERILQRHADRVTKLYIEGRPLIKLGKDVLASKDYLLEPLCEGMHLLTSLRAIRLKNINLCTPRHYARNPLSLYRLVKQPVHLFYSHYSPLTDQLSPFISRHFTALRSLIIAPIEFAQPMYDVVDLISDNWRIPVIDIPIDIMSIESTSQLTSLREIATGCKELRVSINLDVFRDSKVSTQNKVLGRVDRFFQKMIDIKKISQIYIYNIPLRTRYDIDAFHQILQDVRYGRMIVGSIRRTRADKDAWMYACHDADNSTSRWIVQAHKKLMELKKKKKDEKRRHDRVEKWREEERRRQLRSATRVWVQAARDKLEKKWADKERKKVGKERRKKAWRPVLREKRSRALVKALAGLVHAEIEPFSWAGAYARL